MLGVKLRASSPARKAAASEGAVGCEDTGRSARRDMETG